MSGGPRPPLPGLIPLAALSRRRSEPIDAAAGSRGQEARAAAPSRRHHRHHRRRRAVAVGKQSRSSSPALDRPPRVNPIFVWVRQEDTRIVDVKCEDYDKRNRILLTKTAHGWRAIPRTEMLAAPRASAEPQPQEDQQEQQQQPPSHHHHHRHHRRRSRKSKSQVKSASVQFPDPEPAWVTSENVNIESLLPSHTIHVKRTPSESEGSPKSVNSAVDRDYPRTPDNKLCDVSPLENLLAVAELELKQHIQAGSWDEEGGEAERADDSKDDPSIEEIDELLKTKAQEMDIGQIDLTDDDRKTPHECSYNDDDEMSMNDILSRLEQSLQSPHEFNDDSEFDTSKPEPDMTPASTHSEEHVEYDEPEVKQEYNEQSDFQTEPLETNCDLKEEHDEDEMNMKSPYASPDHNSELNMECKPEDIEDVDEDQLEMDQRDIELKIEINSPAHLQEEPNDINDEETVISKEKETSESSSDTPKEVEEIDDAQDVVQDSNEHEEAPQDLIEEQEESQEATQPVNQEQPDEHKPQVESEHSEAPQEQEQIEEPEQSEEQEEQMEAEVEPICLDLSMKKPTPLTIEINTNHLEESEDGPTDLSVPKNQQSPKLDSTRPPSQNSETVQSPQPSGIPAVPPSPDIVSTSSAASKSRSAFLESLLSSSVQKMPLNSEVTITKQKEPLDLGKCRKSASPTVTCSEEITRVANSEPPSKKFKTDDITLKTLLDKDLENMDAANKKSLKPAGVSHSLKVANLPKVSDPSPDPVLEYKQLLAEMDVPNPIMVPKESFPNLLKHPRREILKILHGQTDKNIPLDDILVVYKDRLLAALESSGGRIHSNTNKTESLKSVPKMVNKPVEKNNNDKPPAKRKCSESTTKTSADTSAKNILANDIDAANEAALFWSSCPNPFEAMANYQNHSEFIQALYAASSLPYLPNQLGELHPGLQMILGNKNVPPVGFPSVPPVNFNNPLELSLWQEAMMQASMLRGKNPYENSILNQPNYRTNLEAKRSHSHQSHTARHNARMSSVNEHNKSTLQQQSLLQGLYNQSSMTTNPNSWQNPYLGLGGFQQGSNNMSLSVPPFNPFSHKNSASSSSKSNQPMNSSFLQNQNKESALMAQFNEHEKRLHHQMMQEQQKLQQMQQEKMIRQQHQHLLQQQQQMMKQQNMSKNVTPKVPLLGIQFGAGKDGHQGDKSSADHPKQVQGPIDLSGAQNVKTKGKMGAASVNKTSSKSHVDDVPEVGSTTGNIEEMQDAHALWHPLFGSHNKGYNPWNLPSVTATGE